jgi:hypothetical protein
MAPKTTIGRRGLGRRSRPGVAALAAAVALATAPRVVAEEPAPATARTPIESAEAAQLREASEARAAARFDGTSAEPPSGWSLLPFVLPAYQPETSFLLGAAAVLSHQPPASSGLRQSAISFVGAASVRGQFSVLVTPDMFAFDDAMHIGGAASAARFPDTFYGVGADTSADDSEPYTGDVFDLEAIPRWRIIDSLYVGPSLRVMSASVVELEDGGQLAAGDILGSDGGLTLQVGVSAFWDVRDSTLYPTRGGVARLNVRHSLPELGSDYRFDMLRLEARRYLTLPWRSRHILALMGLIELRRGEPPFYDLGRLGGSEIMRGYYEGRYRERQYYALQAEYRAPLFWRVGAVGFVSLGGVARDVGAELFEYPRLAGGGGLRVAPLADVPINIRLDVAYGDVPSFYFNLGEAF